MEQYNNDKPETVRIEIEISKFSEDFIKAYSKLSKKTPEILYKKILMTGISDIIGTIKHLPHTNLDKFIGVMESVPGESVTLTIPQNKEGENK